MNSLNLKQIDGGNIIKQADSGSMFKFELLDENHKKFEEQLGDTATVILKKDTVAVFKKIVAVTDNCVAFNLDKILEVGDYILEIIVGEYVFPSNNRLKISVESTYGDYQPENLVRITYEEIDEKINALTDRLDDLNIAVQTEMLMRIENLEAKEDKDTIYDDTPIIKRIEKLEAKEDSDTIYDDSELVSRVTALENKPDKDTIYDDAQLKEEISETKSKVNSLSKKVSSLEQKEDHDTIYDDSDIKRRITALENKEDKDTVYDDSEIKRRITALEQKEDHDTIYDDTKIKQSVADVDTKVDNLSEKVTALEERPIVDTALTKRIESLEAREDKDTIYNDTEIKNRLVALEQKEDKDTVYDDSKLVERIENLESDDTTIKERISALEEKPDKDTIYDDSNLKAQIVELESKLQSLNTVRHAPTGYTLDRTTTPWTVWFDNGCGLQFPSQDKSSVYGYGVGINLNDTEWRDFPLQFQILKVSMGMVTIEKMKAINSWGQLAWWRDDHRVINPINDKDIYDWSNVVFATNYQEYKGNQKNIARILYELGIWDSKTVESFGAIKK